MKAVVLIVFPKFAFLFWRAPLLPLEVLRSPFRPFTLRAMGSRLQPPELAELAVSGEGGLQKGSGSRDTFQEMGGWLSTALSHPWHPLGLT